MNKNQKIIDNLKKLIEDKESEKKESKQRCLHKLCSECKGTGIKKTDGTSCVHFISCSCPKCTPLYN